MDIHPEFDPETKTWFWQQYESKTIRELCGKIGPKVRVKDYYPLGYGSSSLITEKQRKLDTAPVFAYETSELRIVSTPKKPPKPAPVVDVADEFKIDKPEKVRVYNLRAPRVAGDPWSKNDLKILRHFVSCGHSASEIAKSLGRSRSAVSGKANRMGLKLHGVR